MKSQRVITLKRRNNSAKSIGRLILIVSFTVSTPLTNIFPYGWIIGKTVHLRVHRFPKIEVSTVHEKERYSHIGYKQSSYNHSTLTSQNLISDYSVDNSAGMQIMFIYLDMIRCQIVDDIKVPLLGVIDTNRTVKNGNAFSIEPNHEKSFSNLNYKNTS